VSAAGQVRGLELLEYILYYYLMTSQVHTLQLGRRLLEIQLEPSGHSTTAVLHVDGEEAGRVTGWWDLRIKVGGLGLVDSAKAAVVVTSFQPGRGSVRLVVPSDEAGFGRPERIDFEPPSGTRAHRRYRWAQDHPRLYAARHVALAAAEIATGLLLAHLTLSFVLGLDWGWLPEWRLPRIPWPDLPEIPWPDIPWPDIDLPDWSMPGWLAAVLATKKYWFPILVAIAVAVSEVKRRRRRQAEKENAAWPAPSTPRSTQPADSRSSTPD